MDLYKLLIVGSGGFLGSVARFALVRFCDQKIAGVFPYGTLTVNLIGSFILGMVYMFHLRGDTSDNWRLFLATGICGGFTTFSAFALENFVMVHGKMAGTSLLYIGSSMILGILAIALGAWCTRFL